MHFDNEIVVYCCCIELQQVDSFTFLDQSLLIMDSVKDLSEKSLRVMHKSQLLWKKSIQTDSCWKPLFCSLPFKRKLDCRFSSVQKKSSRCFLVGRDL